jgi:hypothetical protein
MRRLVLTVGLMLMFATTLGRISPVAAAGGSLTFDPSTVTAGGGKLFVDGSCDPNSSGFVISKAFADQPGGTEFAGVPALAITTGADGTFGIGLTIDPKVAAGSYGVTLRCGGGLAASGTLRVLNPTLPGTGAPVTRLVVGAALVLAIGVGLSMAARRRPVRA